jgi:nitrite transporter NirC
MFKEEYSSVSNAAAAKLKMLKNSPAAYFVLSILAGMYVGFGVLLVFTLAGQMSGEPYTKLIMGLTFSVALSLVIMAGAELFTGNNLVMSAGILNKTVSIKDTLYLWLVCWVGNLVGAVFLSLIFAGTGLYSGATLTAITDAAASKMTAGPVQLLTRGVLCNMLVCLAVWCGFKLKTESGKLIMIVLCILAFFTTGFEHSIANMTTLTLSLIDGAGNKDISFVGYIYNLALVTIGNIIGGVALVSIPYYISTGQKD